MKCRHPKVPTNMGPQANKNKSLGWAMGDNGHLPTHTVKHPMQGKTTFSQTNFMKTI